MSIYGVGQVWLVRLSSYRLWAYVGQHEFRAYHAAWWRSIWGAILAPAALVLGTAFEWGPLMARLEAPSGRLSLECYQLLMRTHWLRVAIITAYALLMLWMLSRNTWSA